MEDGRLSADFLDLVLSVCIASMAVACTRRSCDFAWYLRLIDKYS